jgi:hypothetical protein
MANPTLCVKFRPKGGRSSLSTFSGPGPEFDRGFGVYARHRSPIRCGGSAPSRRNRHISLRTIFTEKIAGLVHLRSGTSSPVDIIAAQLSGELSDAEMETLTRRHCTEFCQIYLTGDGRNGGGGTHFLIQGNASSNVVVIGPNVRVKQHTHPNYGSMFLAASPADYRLRQFHSEMTPQQLEKIVTLNEQVFRFQVSAGPFEVDDRARSVKLEINGDLVTVPVLTTGSRMPVTAAEIQIPGDPWYGQAYQMLKDRHGNYSISHPDWGAGCLPLCLLPESAQHRNRALAR